MFTNADKEDFIGKWEIKPQHVGATDVSKTNV